MIMFNRFIFILLVLVLTACGGKEDPVIGVQTLNNNEGTKAVVRLQYFDSEDAAFDFYYEKGVIDYALMVHPEKDEKSLYEEIAAEEKNGMKSIEFSSQNGSLADNLAFEYLYEKLGLGIQCAFNGKECK